MADTNTVAVRSAEQARQLALAHGIRFSQLDDVAKIDLLSNVRQSLGDLLPTKVDVEVGAWKFLAKVIWRQSGSVARFLSFYVLLVFFLSVFVAIRRPTPAFGILLFVSLVSIIFSVAAGVTFIYLTFYVNEKLSEIEQALLDALKSSDATKVQE